MDISRRPTIVLFDMDGTTVRHLNRHLLGLLEFLDDTGFKFTSLWQKIGLVRKKLLSDNGIVRDPPRRPRLIVHRTLHKLRRKSVEQIVEPCPGVRDVLAVLKHHGITLGIVSNGLGKGYGHDVLKAFDFEDFFTASVFREDIERSKPHPDPLLKALERIRPVTADDTVWYIGDRHKDITAALAAGTILPCPVIPFAYGLNASAAIMENGLPMELIISSYQDFAHKLAALLGRPLA